MIFLLMVIYGCLCFINVIANGFDLISLGGILLGIYGFVIIMWAIIEAKRTKWEK